MWGPCAAPDDALIMVGGSRVGRASRASAPPDHDEELPALRTGLEWIRIAILGDETQQGALATRLFESD